MAVSVTFCVFCESGYSLAIDGSGCVTEPTEHCQIKNVDGKCETCNYGYYMDVDKNCVDADDVYDLSIFGKGIIQLISLSLLLFYIL